MSVDSVNVDAVRAEWVKLVTVRSTQVSYALVGILTVGIAALVAAAETKTDNGVALLGMAFQSGLPSLGLVVLFVAAVLSTTAEWRTGTFKTTFLTTPNRPWAIAAKALVVGAFGALVGVLSVALGVLVAGALARSGAAELGFSGDLRLLWTIPVVAFLGAFFASGIGNLIRHSAGAVTLLVVWMVVFEPLLVALVEGISNRALRVPDVFLPFLGLGRFVSGAAHGLTQLGPQASLAVFAAWSLGLFALGVVATVRRDP